MKSVCSGAGQGRRKPEFPLKPSLDGRSMLGLGANTFLKSEISSTEGRGGASDWAEELDMSRVAIWAQLEAKPGKERELEEFLKSAQPLAEREPDTVSWYALKMGPGRYGIFDTFADENGRNAHLNGEIAKALFSKAKDLLAKPPDILKPEILAVKS
jgi:quinol monooxygenase YgiN